MNTYIIASAKNWHFRQYELVSRQLEGSWRWVDSPEALSQVLELEQPRYIFFLHWSWKVPEHTWSRYECVCFHMSDVPYGRGGSPLQNLIALGHKNTKLTALRMEAEVDAGPVYAKKPLSLEGRAEDIYLRAGELSFEIIRHIIQTEPLPTPQEGEVVTFTRRAPDQSKLPLEGSLETFYDHVRMLDAEGYPAAFLEYGAFRLNFSEGKIENGKLHVKATVSTLAPDGKTEL